MAAFSLVEKPKRRMLQPTKAYLRAELKLAEVELLSQQEVIDRQREEIEALRRPFWQRLLRKRA